MFNSTHVMKVTNVLIASRTSCNWHLCDIQVWLIPISFFLSGIKSGAYKMLHARARPQGPDPTVNTLSIADALTPICHRLPSPKDLAAIDPGEDCSGPVEFRHSVIAIIPGSSCMRRGWLYDFRVPVSVRNSGRYVSNHIKLSDIIHKSKIWCI